KLLWKSMSLKSLIDESVNLQTRQLALHVILAAAYGFQFDWDDTDAIWNGHQMGFKDALRPVIDDILILALVPSFLLRVLPFKSFQKANQSHHEAKTHFKELINIEKRGQVSKSVGRTILGILVENSVDVAQDGEV